MNVWYFWSLHTMGGRVPDYLRPVLLASPSI